MKNCTRKWCLKLYAFLYVVTCAFEKMWRKFGIENHYPKSYLDAADSQIVEETKNFSKFVRVLKLQKYEKQHKDSLAMSLDPPPFDCFERL